MKDKELQIRLLISKIDKIRETLIELLDDELELERIKNEKKNKQVK